MIFSLGALGCSPLGEPIDSNVSTGYYHAKSGQGVVFSAQGKWVELGHYPVVGADPKTFRPLADNLGMDSKHVYYRQHAQPQIDRSSFGVHAHVWRDAAHVYYAADRERLVEIEGADPKTFQYIPTENNPKLWAKDATHYYRQHHPVKVDAPTFHFLNQEFVADRQHIYRNQDNLPRVAAVTGPIKVINDFHLQMGDQILSAGNWGIKALSFDAITSIRPIGNQLLVVNQQVYLKGKKLDKWDGDVATLEVMPGSETYARDAKNIYTLRPNFRRVDGADRSSFAPFKAYGAYAVDAQRVYYQGAVVNDADRASFKIATDVRGPYAQDKNGRFLMGARE